jgi:hypothetical protein
LEKWWRLTSHSKRFIECQQFDGNVRYRMLYIASTTAICRAAAQAQLPAHLSVLLAARLGS